MRDPGVASLLVSVESAMMREQVPSSLGSLMPGASGRVDFGRGS